MNKTIEEYIEKIYIIEKRDGRAKTGVIALEMGVKDSSVTEMLQKLEEKGYLEYEPYHGVNLTERGNEVACDLMKRHEVIAAFLEIIGVKQELAEIDACQMEHHVTQKTMDRLEKFVEFINESPKDPKWIKHFEHYLETGERVECDLYGKESNNERDQ